MPVMQKAARRSLLARWRSLRARPAQRGAALLPVDALPRSIPSASGRARSGGCAAGASRPPVAFLGAQRARGADAVALRAQLAYLERSSLFYREELADALSLEDVTMLTKEQLRA